MLSSRSEHSLAWIQAGLLAVLVLQAGLFILRTLHWSMVGDAGLTHYIVFMIDHGLSPYRNIVDMNMPGSYLVEWAVMHTLGGGALAWRFFDLALMALATIAMIAIAARWDWRGGVISAMLFVLIHGRDGVGQLGERDLTLAVLLLVGCSLLFSSETKRFLWRFPCFGFCVGLAALIKPQAIVWGLVLGIFFLVKARRAGGPVLQPALGAVAGFGASLLIALCWLGREHSLYAFWQITRGLAAYHAGIERFPAGYLVLHAIPSALLPLVGLWLVIAGLNRGWKRGEYLVLVACALLGVASFVLQGKNFPYHRYPLDAFLLMLIGIDIMTALRQQKTAARLVGVTALAYAVLVIAPTSLIRASGYDGSDGVFITHLEQDLNELGGQRLSGQIQCMDTTAGCVTTLYDMKLMQSTGFLYDCYFFRPSQTAVTEAMREEFMKDLASHPPEVFVVSSQLCFRGPNDYHKLDRWPEFESYLNANYSLNEQWMPPRQTYWSSYPGEPLGYRIYVRHGG